MTTPSTGAEVGAAPSPAPQLERFTFGIVEQSTDKGESFSCALNVTSHPDGAFVRFSDVAEALAAATAREQAALKILDTQSGDDLLDACRQVKQVAISERDNSEKFAQREQALHQLVAQWLKSSDRSEVGCAEELAALLPVPEPESALSKKSAD